MRRHARTPSILLAVAGATIAAWGVVGVLAASPRPTGTVLDSLLAPVARFVSPIGLGVLLMTGAALAADEPAADHRRPVRAVVAGTGLLLVLVGVVLTSITLNPLWGGLYIAPVLLTGMLFVLFGTGHLKRRRSIESP